MNIYRFPAQVLTDLSIVQEKVGGSRPSLPHTWRSGGTRSPNEKVHTPATISMMLNLVKRNVKLFYKKHAPSHVAKCSEEREREPKIFYPIIHLCIYIGVRDSISLEHF